RSEDQRYQHGGDDPRDHDGGSGGSRGLVCGTEKTAVGSYSGYWSASSSAPIAWSRTTTASNRARRITAVSRFADTSVGRSAWPARNDAATWPARCCAPASSASAVASSRVAAA